MLDSLSGAKYFTTLDLASGYWQVCMDPSSQEKTTFVTYSGHEFRKMPFELVNVPATFQKLVEIVLTGLARDGCMVYLDDVLVVGRDFEEHSSSLAKVFEQLQLAGLTLKPEKYKFAHHPEVHYLGHVVSAEGAQTNPCKLKAVSEFPVPNNVKSLRSFLGLASYYQRFIPQFARIAGPLHNFTKKDVEFTWTNVCQKAFENQKKLLASAPVLSYPDFSVPFTLETDAMG